MKYILLFCLTIAIIRSADAQNLELQKDGFAPLFSGRIRFVDLDNDNDLDLINNGLSEDLDKGETKVYENANGTFIERTTTIPDVRNGDFALGDFDNDNDIDILVTGYLNSSVNFGTELYENKGGFIFAKKTTLKAVFNSTASFFDLENDGDQDIALAGRYYMSDGAGGQLEKAKIFIFENKAGAFVEVPNTNVESCFQCAMDFADRNGDGLIDIATLGLNEQFKTRTTVYLNNGDKTFTIDPMENFDDAGNGVFSWGDFDNDGDNDVLISGSAEFTSMITKVYENTGTGWKARPDIHLEPIGDLYYGSIRWVDYNADGFLDIALMGRGNPLTELRFHFKIYLNDQHGNFSLLNMNPPVEVAEASLDFGDFDNDGDTDFGFMGIGMINGDVDGRKIMTGILKNLALQKAFGANTKPNAPNPSDFSEISLFRKNLVLRWKNGTDAETPSAQLNYNVRVRNASKNILLPAADFSTGYIRTDKSYNAATTKLWLSNIPEGEIFWSVQSVDAAESGSLFSLEKQFHHINGPEATAAKIVDPTHVHLTWNDNSSIETNYRVERSLNETKDFTTVETVPANTVSVTNEHSFLTDTYYYYRISAYDNVASSGYDSLKVLIPTAPASLAGSATATLIQLTWSDLSSYEKGYVLERKLSTETTFVAIADLPAGATSFQNTGLAEATLYEYRVVAYNEYGQSAYSNILSIKTNSRPVSEDAELEVEENSTLLIAAEDFEQHYSDADLDPLHHILITLLPANGKLKLNNANVFVNQTINASALDMLTFVPNTDVLGDMIIGYRVHDGKDYSAQTYKLTVKVVPIITGVEDEKLTDLEYFPVPVTNALHLRSTTAKVKEVTLMDLSGRTFMTKSLAMGETTLDLTSCPPGVYMLQVKTGNVLRAYKLIKR